MSGLAFKHEALKLTHSVLLILCWVSKSMVLMVINVSLHINGPHQLLGTWADDKIIKNINWPLGTGSGAQHWSLELNPFFFRFKGFI